MTPKQTGLRAVLNVLELFTELERTRGWSRVLGNIDDDTDFGGTSGITTRAGSKNTDYNRYCDVMPYDHTRVVLKDHIHDYINASHVTSPVVPKHYICSQGPMNHTKEDFWRMVWQEGSTLIVMLNAGEVKGRPYHLQCGEYWPPSVMGTGLQDTFRCADFKVTLTRKEVTDLYTLRELCLTKLHQDTQPARTITHLQFHGWHDFGVPESPGEFLKFLKVARSYDVMSGAPPVVHCLAGVGRTGTFVFVDSILRIIEEKRSLNVDIGSVLRYLRHQRIWLVQTPSQFRFAVRVIVEGVKEIEIVGEERVVAEPYQIGSADIGTLPGQP